MILKNKTLFNFYLLPILTHCWKTFSIYFMAELFILLDKKSNGGNSALSHRQPAKNLFYYKPVWAIFNKIW